MTACTLLVCSALSLAPSADSISTRALVDTRDVDIST
jgi:hypothetical protein